MRILYLNKHFPGPFQAVASYLATQKAVSSLFLAEKSTHTPSIPNIRRLHIPTLLPAQSSKDSPPTERMMIQALRWGSYIANTLLKLRSGGYYPDIVYTSPEEGYSLYLPDIFPKSRIIIRANWFNIQGDYYTFFNKGAERPPTEFALNRLSNLLQFNIFSHAEKAIISSEWQKKQYPEELVKKISVIRDGIKTQLFVPSKNTTPDEIVVYSCQGIHPARGIETLRASLPLLLKQRPACKVCVVSFHAANKKNTQTAKQISEKYFPDLSPQERERVHIFESLNSQDYIRLLQHCSAYIYLTAPFTLSAGLHEAMSCGACVIASDTGPVKDTIRHAENGFLCDFWNAEALADAVAGVLERRSQLKYISNNAREFIVEHHDYQKQLDKHVDLILQK